VRDQFVFLVGDIVGIHIQIALDALILGIANARSVWKWFD
jgi:hypothetical protein